MRLTCATCKYKHGIKCKGPNCDGDHENWKPKNYDSVRMAPCKTDCLDCGHFNTEALLCGKMEGKQ